MPEPIEALQQIMATATVEVRDKDGNLVETITTSTPITAAQARALQGDPS